MTILYITHSLYIYIFTGKFAFHFKWVSLRLGLDENNIVFNGLTWKNPTNDFKNSSYILYIEQICIRFDFYSLIQSIRYNTSIKIKEIRIENVIICIEKCDNQKNNNTHPDNVHNINDVHDDVEEKKMKIKAGRYMLY